LFQAVLMDRQTSFPSTGKGTQISLTKCLTLSAPLAVTCRRSTGGFLPGEGGKTPRTFSESLTSWTEEKEGGEMQNLTELLDWADRWGLRIVPTRFFLPSGEGRWFRIETPEGELVFLALISESQELLDCFCPGEAEAEV